MLRFRYPFYTDVGGSEHLHITRIKAFPDKFFASHRIKAKVDTVVKGTLDNGGLVLEDVVLCGLVADHLVAFSSIDLIATFVVTVLIFTNAGLEFSENNKYRVLSEKPALEFWKTGRNVVNDWGITRQVVEHIDCYNKMSDVEVVLFVIVLDDRLIHSLVVTDKAYVEKVPPYRRWCFTYRGEESL